MSLAPKSDHRPAVQQPSGSPLAFEPSVSLVTQAVPFRQNRRRESGSTPPSGWRAFVLVAARCSAVRSARGSLSTPLPTARLRAVLESSAHRIPVQASSERVQAFLPRVDLGVDLLGRGMEDSRRSASSVGAPTCAPTPGGVCPAVWPLDVCVVTRWTLFTFTHASSTY